MGSAEELERNHSAWERLRLQNQDERLLKPYLDEAKNGLETMELARTTLPDLVVMDVHMPIMGGLEATRLIKAAIHGVYVVRASAMSEDEVRTAAPS